MPKSTDHKSVQWKQHIDNWDLKESTSLLDGSLKQLIVSNGITSVDRRAILFSTVLCLCKSISHEKWKLKDKISLRKFNVYDHVTQQKWISNDWDQQCLFEIHTDDRHILFVTRSEEEKKQWLCLLIYIRNKR